MSKQLTLEEISEWSDEQLLDALAHAYWLYKNSRMRMEVKTERRYHRDVDLLKNEALRRMKRRISSRVPF